MGTRIVAVFVLIICNISSIIININKMIFGLVKLNGRNKLERSIRRDHKIKKIVINIIYGTIGFLLLNFVLYALSSN